ncbi:hypothetical protein L6164_003227 [Bauhinia variegata]|uniref:Uncharacterized protein n=1 Tax=Bauhinia variegata TaxID=167791 RepID=A0ACB9Q024_BAUVA|nr:hypothetical protein L6164_003227 [Bauhinia variegata]
MQRIESMKESLPRILSTGSALPSFLVASLSRQSPEDPFLYPSNFPGSLFSSSFSGLFIVSDLVWLSRNLSKMTRGNQRERDRERAQTRNPGKGKGKDDGLTPEQRRERDAKALQEKAAKKAGQAAGGNNSGGGGKK